MEWETVDIELNNTSVVWRRYIQCQLTDRVRASEVVCPMADQKSTDFLDKPAPTLCRLTPARCSPI